MPSRETRPAARVTVARRGVGRAITIVPASAGFDVVGSDIAKEGMHDAGLW